MRWISLSAPEVSGPVAMIVRSPWCQVTGSLSAACLGGVVGGRAVDGVGGTVTLVVAALEALPRWAWSTSQSLIV